MYNGVGLPTPRGSGTSGHVQRNCAAVRKKDKKRDSGEGKPYSTNRQPNKEILEHTRKREIEVKCIELSDTLEDQGYDQKEIDEKVESYRKILMESYMKSNNKNQELDELGRPITRNSHETAEAQIERNKKLRDAFGLPSIEDNETPISK